VPKAKRKLVICPVCHGEGEVLFPLPKNPFNNFVECRKCHGDGAVRVMGD